MLDRFDRDRRDIETAASFNDEVFAAGSIELNRASFAEMSAAGYSRDSVYGGRDGFSADRERYSGGVMYGPSYSYDSYYVPPQYLAYDPYDSYGQPGYYSQPDYYSRDSVYGGRDGFTGVRIRDYGGNWSSGGYNHRNDFRYYDNYGWDYGNYGYGNQGCYDNRYGDCWGGGGYISPPYIERPYIIPPRFEPPRFYVSPPRPPILYGGPPVVYGPPGRYDRDSVYGGRDGYYADRQRYRAPSYGHMYDGYSGSPSQVFDFALRGFDSWAGYDIARRHAKGQYR